MFKKVTLAAAAGVGYVFGAKAGTQRYEQIMSKLREFAGMPAVQNATATVQDTAGSLADKAKTTVNEKVGSSSQSGTGGGLGTTGTGGGLGTTGTGADTGATAAGAAPSATAPIAPGGDTPPVVTRP